MGRDGTKDAVGDDLVLRRTFDDRSCVPEAAVREHVRSPAELESRPETVEDQARPLAELHRDLHRLAYRGSGLARQFPLSRSGAGGAVAGFGPGPAAGEGGAVVAEGASEIVVGVAIPAQDCQGVVVKLAVVVEGDALAV